MLMKNQSWQKNRKLTKRSFQISEFILGLSMQLPQEVYA